MYYMYLSLRIFALVYWFVQVIRSYHGHLSGVYCLALHPTLDILMTGGRDSVCRVRHSVLLSSLQMVHFQLIKLFVFFALQSDVFST